ncbi:MFS transporter [Roseibium salinum]|nr:MFS transporter [Roseibium salinum]
MLPRDTTDAMRHFDYGLIIGVFFICWFLGAPYISKLSDVIGRKNAILICLFGALGGYALTIGALYMNSFPLLILGRAITGLTAGNQPIAQAAMIDGSADEEDRNRNMGYIITGVSFGLVGGPIIGGFLSDPQFLGSISSVKLPFYACFALVAIAIALVLFTFREPDEGPAERQPFVFRPAEIFELLWQIRKYPKVLRLTMVFFFFHIANMSFYIFVDNYLTSRFDYGTLGGSMVMLTIGVALAFFQYLPGGARAKALQQAGDPRRHIRGLGGFRGSICRISHRSFDLRPGVLLLLRVRHRLPDLSRTIFGRRQR